MTPVPSGAALVRVRNQGNIIMDRNFAKSLSLVLKHEGGWADHPKDPGGATMKGVTLANFRRYVKPGATKDDLRKISDQQVATVYRRFYWDAVAGSELPDGVDFAVFDFAVNSGPSRAAKYLQAIVGVAQDGRIGPATIKAVKNQFPATIIHKLCDNRLAFMKRIRSNGRPLWDTFGKGWASRVKSVRSDALAMSSQPIANKPTIPDPAPASPEWGKPIAKPAPAKSGLAAFIAAILSLFKKGK